MKVLIQAAKSAHSHKLEALRHQALPQYSKFPVHETEFWTTLFAFAKNPKTAQKVLDEIAEIEAEPCIDNQRVFLAVETAKRKAKLTLLSKGS